MTEETETSPAEGDVGDLGGDDCRGVLRARTARERLVVRLCQSLAELINAGDVEGVTAVLSLLSSLPDATGLWAVEPPGFVGRKHD